MTGVGFLILFGLSFVLFPSQGQITSPPNGAKLTFLNGSTENITWSFNDDVSKVRDRAWYFTSSDGSFDAKLLASISRDLEPQIEKSGLSGVTIVKPATLIFKNVNQTYNGTYRFTLSAPVGGSFHVLVFIAITPTVTVNCSSPVTLIAGDYFACECKGEGGNPPADVTWYKGNKPIVTGSKIAVLSLTDVNKDDNGTYRCEAKSHEKAKNETDIEIIVYYPPENVTLTLRRYGDNATITCNAEIRPAPGFEIFVNETKLVKRDKTYNIPEVNISHVGNYTCVAWNIAGNKTSNAEYLSLEVKPYNTKITITQKNTEVGESVTITCNSEGLPEPSYKITHDDIMVSGGKMHTISKVQLSDDGTYKCIAENKLGKESASVYLTVEGKPSDINITITPQEAVVGELVNITCNFEGRPEPNYTITRNGTMLSTDKMYIISKVQLSDNGTYECIAENKLGKGSDFANLIVEVQPNNTNITITPEEAKVGESVNITCYSEGRPEPRYNISHEQRYNIIIPKVMVLSADKPYTISNATMNDAGTYKCTAWNKHGTDEDSKILTVVGEDEGKGGLVIGAIIGIVVGVLVLLVIVIVVVCCCKSKEKDGYRGNADVSPGASGGLAENQYELDGEPSGGVDNTYDTVNNPGASGSKSKLPENSTTAVYAAVDKKNKEGKPLYATLDSLALEQADNSKKKRDEERPGQTEYASIDFAKIGKVDQE